MTEKTKFRIKFGEIEIEMEGEKEIVLPHYENAFEWISKKGFERPHEKEPIKSDATAKSSDKKESKRGGPSKAKWSPLLDELIKEGFFDLPNQRTVEDILKEIEKKGIPLGETARTGITVALPRKVRKTELERAKDEKGQWRYYIHQLSS